MQWYCLEIERAREAYGIGIRCQSFLKTERYLNSAHFCHFFSIKYCVSVLKNVCSVWRLGFPGSYLRYLLTISNQYKDLYINVFRVSFGNPTFCQNFTATFSLQRCKVLPDHQPFFHDFVCTLSTEITKGQGRDSQLLFAFYHLLYSTVRARWCRVEFAYIATL